MVKVLSAVGVKKYVELSMFLSGEQKSFYVLQMSSYVQLFISKRIVRRVELHLIILWLMVVTERYCRNST